MIPNGNWSYPTQIRFGLQQIQHIAAACRDAGIKRPLFVTDRGLASAPVTQSTLSLLRAASIEYGCFTEVDSNPTDSNLSAGVEAFTAGKHDGVIAFGGGSGLDLGKLIAFMAGQTRPVWDFVDKSDWWTRANSGAIAPIITIPTTAGTGSEVGRAAVVTNSHTHEKQIIFHPKLLATIVICDPELTVGMPQAITAGTGLDALAHCVEAFSSPHYHPMSQGIALEGMRLAIQNLPRAYANPKDIEARAHMMSAALMGAVAFQKGLGAVHALSHPIGALFNTHHGTTNAVCMPAVLRFNAPAISERFTQVAAYLGISGGFPGFQEHVQNLNDQLGIPRRLSEIGADKAAIDQLVPMALSDPSCGGNPIELNATNIRSLFEELL